MLFLFWTLRGVARIQASLLMGCLGALRNPGYHSIFPDLNAP